MDCAVNAKSTTIEPHQSPQAINALRHVQRHRLLDAMADVVGEKGFAAASVSAVCARAKLSRQTFSGAT
ncbi:MAG TPA: hypothetical protein VIG42_07990 [Solirubrobacteraceae bacterium]|jgi:AcrR family transcriptional regulator